MRDADALVVMTEWQAFRAPDFDLLRDKLKAPVVFDGRNLYEPARMARYGFAYYAIGRGLGRAAGGSRDLRGLSPLRVLVTGAAGFIGFHVARALLARGDAVTGFDNVNDYYDSRLKEARLAELGKAGGDWRFLRADLADRAAVEAAFAGRAVRAGDPPRRPGRGALQPREPGAPTSSRNLTRLHPCARGLPGRRDPAPHLRLDLERLRRQHRHALHRGPGRGPSAAVLRRDQAGERADGARLRAPLPPALHRLALLHRLRALGAAGHGADDLRAGDRRGPADPALQPGPAQPRLHLHRRHRRGGDPRLRPPCPARPDWDPAAPDPATSNAPFRIYNIGNSAPVELADFIAALERELGRDRRSASCCRCSPATCPTPSPTARGSRARPAGARRPRSPRGCAASSPGTGSITTPAAFSPSRPGPHPARFARAGARPPAALPGAAEPSALRPRGDRGGPRRPARAAAAQPLPARRRADPDRRDPGRGAGARLSSSPTTAGSGSTAS